MNEEVRHFSLRKLSVGLASVLVGVSIFGASQTVKADTVADQTASAVTGSVQSKDTQENKNATESSFSNDNQVANAKSNMAQTQENGSKQVQAENVQQDSVPKTQEATDGSDLDAEKSATRAGSLQEPDNQLNTVTGKTAQHNTLESGQKTQSFNLPKNSQKLNRRVLATNLSETTSSPTTNGGFDEATWGKLDVTKWQGSVQDGFYQLTKYTGDLSHVIIPNEADFEQAGKSTNGLQVGIDCDTAKSLSVYHDQTIAFSKTNSQKVKAIGTNWSLGFNSPNLIKFDGSNLDVSGVTDMSNMFYNSQVSDLTSLSNWDTSKVTNMEGMFGSNNRLTMVDGSITFVGDNSIRDLSPLANWDTSNVTNMSNMFTENSISDLTPLANWKTSKVTDMSNMFGNRVGGNTISDLSPLANWDVSKVANMSNMFRRNRVSDLTPLTNWDTSNVTNMSGIFLENKVSDLAPLTNWDVDNATNMSGMFTDNKISDLRPLAHWDTSKVTNMSGMFSSNKISDLTGLANWNVSNVNYMSGMFEDNPDLIDLRPIANWNMSSISYWGSKGLFRGDTKLDLTNINNTPLMQSFLKKHIMLQGTTFIIDDVDFVTKLVKATTGKDVSTLTNTATRTIVFNFPDGTSKTVTQHIYYKAVAPVQVEWPAPPKSSGSVIEKNLIVLNPPLLAEKTPIQADPNDSNPTHPYSPKIIKTYPAKDPDWQLDTSQTKPEDVNVVNGRVYFKSVPIPYFKGYKAEVTKIPNNSMKLMVSFMAVPTENTPSTPVEVTPSKPAAPVDNPSKPSAPTDNPNKSANDLQKRVVTELNSNDSGWTMPVDISNSTYTVEVPKDATIDLSDLVIAEPVHAQTRTQIHVTKRFKLSKKHLIKHLKHRKLVSKLFSKRYVSL